MDAAPFCDVIAGKSGAVLSAHLKNALTAPTTYFYGQLFHAAEVQQLPADEPHRALLELMSYGTYGQLSSLQPSAQALVTPVIRKKLRHLTIVSLAAATRQIPYALLQTELQMPDLRDMEDTVIDVITEGLIGGKLDPLARVVDVHEATSRDVRVPGDVKALLASLRSWAARVDATSAQLTDLLRDADRSEHAYRKESTDVAAETLMVEGRCKMELAAQFAVTGTSMTTFEA